MNKTPQGIWEVNEAGMPHCSPAHIPLAPRSTLVRYLHFGFLNLCAAHTVDGLHAACCPTFVSATADFAEPHHGWVCKALHWPGIVRGPADLLNPDAFASRTQLALLAELDAPAGRTQRPLVAELRCSCWQNSDAPAGSDTKHVPSRRL